MDEQKKIIPVGTVIRGGDKTLEYIKRFLPAGIESVQIYFWGRIPEGIGPEWVEKLSAFCREQELELSAMALFSNPFEEGEPGAAAADGWPELLRLAEIAGVKIVSGFTGRVPGRPVEESIEPVTAFFSPLIEDCEKKGISLAFENCPMGGNWQSGSWNIAFCSEVWEILLNQKFKSGRVGIELDPSHCVGYAQPAVKLLKEWTDRILHVHGKDAVRLPGEDAVNGWLGPNPPYEERFPGEGSLDWREIFTRLNENGYSGTVDIEGYHGDFVSHKVEAENQKRAVEYLKRCR